MNKKAQNQVITTIIIIILVIVATFIIFLLVRGQVKDKYSDKLSFSKGGQLEYESTSETEDPVNSRWIAISQSILKISIAITAILFGIGYVIKQIKK